MSTIFGRKTPQNGNYFAFSQVGSHPAGSRWGFVSVVRSFGIRMLYVITLYTLSQSRLGLTSFSRTF